MRAGSAIRALSSSSLESSSQLVGSAVDRCFFGDQRFVFFEEGTDPADFRDHVLRALPEDVPLFGRPTGFIVNYTPDRAVEFDLRGSEVVSYAKAFRPGKGSFKFSDGWYKFPDGRPDDLEDWPPLRVRRAAFPKQLQDSYRKERGH